MAKKMGPGGVQTDFGGGKDATYFEVGSSVKKCYDGHPVLTINGGTFAGGSCLYPVHKDFDAYIGFDSGMRFSGRQYPWTSGDEFLMPITDQKTPRDVEAFVILVDWVWGALGAGKKVHAGCIGGHGRTGLLVAALAHKMGEAHPIAWTRENYCDKAVESAEQIKFLADHFGGEPDAEPRQRKKGWGGWTGSGDEGGSGPGPRGKEKVRPWDGGKRVVAPVNRKAAFFDIDF